MGQGLLMEHLIPPHSIRLLITGCYLQRIANAISLPLGTGVVPMSTPAVSLAFWAIGKCTIYYCLDTLLDNSSAMAGAALVFVWEGMLSQCHLTVLTLPGPTYPLVVCILAEASMTCLLVLSILFLSVNTGLCADTLDDVVLVATMV